MIQALDTTFIDESNYYVPSNDARDLLDVAADVIRVIVDNFTFHALLPNFKKRKDGMACAIRRQRLRKSEAAASLGSQLGSSSTGRWWVMSPLVSFLNTTISEELFRMMGHRVLKRSAVLVKRRLLCVRLSSPSWVIWTWNPCAS